MYIGKDKNHLTVEKLLLLRECKYFCELSHLACVSGSEMLSFVGKDNVSN